MPGTLAPRVLVVDDNAAARDALRLALEREGVVVVGEAGAYAYLVKGCSPGLVHDVVEMAWKLKVGLERRQLGTTAPPAG
jgi:AmiR/NasT family two-component response regulator